MRHQAKQYVTHWLDESYRGREDELVTTGDIAQIAGVDPRTVNGWIRGYDHFPDPVKTVKSGPAPSRFFATTDVVVWLVEHRGMSEELVDFAADLDDHIREVREALATAEQVRDQILDAVRTAGSGDTDAPTGS